MKTKSKTRSASNIRTKKTENKKAVLKKPSSPLKSKGKIVKNNPKTTSTTKIISSSKKDSSDKAAKEWQITFDAVSDAICLLDKKQRILRTNRAMQEMFGLSPKALIGNFCWEIVHCTTKPVPDCPATKLLKSLKPEKMELRVKDKIFNVRAFPVLDDKNTLSAIVHIISDITESKQTEEKLADERRQLNYILDVTKTRIDIIDSDFNLRFVDDPWQKIYGDPTGRKCYEYFMGRKSPCDNCGIPKALDSRQVVITEEVLTREGNRTIEVHTIPFQNKEGEWLVAEFNIDISVRKEAEEALKKSRENYRRLFDDHSAVKLIIDPETGMIIDANHAAADYYGWSRDELKKMKIWQINTLSENEVKAEMDKALQKKGGRFEFRHRLANGSTRDVEVYSSNIEIDGQNMLHSIIHDVTERKDMEKKLLENETRYKRIAENMSGFVSEMDAYGIFRYNSPSIRTLLGYDPEELNNRNAFDFVHSEDHDRVLAKYMEGSQTETEKEVEQRYRRKDNTYIWLRSTGRPIYGPDGKNTGMIVNSIDITERKKAEELLRVEEERFRTLTEQSSDIIILIDPKGKIIYENPAIEHILGYNFQKRINQNVFENVHPDDLNYFIDLFNILIKGEIPPVKMAEVRIRHADGTWRIFEAVGNIVKKGESIEMIIANLRDITERKISENALQKSETKYRTLFEAATDGIAVLEKDTFSDCNQQMLEIFGYSRENFIGQTPYNLSPEFQPDGSTSKEKALSMINAALAGNQQLFEWMHTRSDGTPIYMEVSLNAVKEMGDFYIQVICRNISERKRAERELLNYRDHLESLVKERTKELEAFSYSVSHDLRAPLRSIEGFSQAIWEDFQDKLDDHGKDYLKRIRNASNLMTELIDDMLKLSRITSTDIDMIDVDLSGIAHSVMNSIKKSHPERKVNVKITDHLTDYADLRLMRIVFQNLLGNAWKFTAKKSNAEIEFSQMINNGQKVYYVRDNGAGFNENYAEKLFAPFQRLHNVEEYPGTGVGLAIVRRIINRHGGKVWARGQTDQGATFYFTLKG